MKRLGNSDAHPAAGDQPHSLSGALERVKAEVAPRTLLAAVQGSWPAAAGETVAAQASPVAEREGVVTVACRSATWAQELDLMQAELVERLRARLDGGPFANALLGLRFSADAARHASDPP